MKKSILLELYTLYPSKWPSRVKKSAHVAFFAGILRFEEFFRLNKHGMIIMKGFPKIKHRYLSCVRKLDYAGEESGNFHTFASPHAEKKKCDKRNIILIIHRRWWFFIKNSSRRHFSCCWGIHLAYLRELLKKKANCNFAKGENLEEIPSVQIKF